MLNDPNDTFNTVCLYTARLEERDSRSGAASANGGAIRLMQTLMRQWRTHWCTQWQSGSDEWL